MDIYFIKNILNEIITTIKIKNIFLNLIIGLIVFLFFTNKLLIILIFGFFLFLFSSKFVRICLKTMDRDLKGYFRLKKLQNEMEKQWKINLSIGNIFENTVNKFKEKKCIIESETGKYISFEELNYLSNKFGNYFNEKKYNDDYLPYSETKTFGILLENSIEFVAIWLGLSKIGIETSWINTQLCGQSLVHSINIVNCKVIITSKIFVKELIKLINDGLLNSKIKVFVISECQNIPNNFELININELNNKTKPFTSKHIGFKDILAYLYTSGTTGQPKAVIIRHYRYYFMGIAGPLIFGIKSNDIIYISLPMYHGMAGIAGVGQMIVNGCTIVIRQKFSASHFWEDCSKFNCTIAIYIGEICRYLLSQPNNNYLNKHKIRMFCGLGLRSTIWENFKKRFKIEQIAELYGATEGNATCVNINNYIGAIGFLPIYTYFKKTTSIRIVKVDPITRKYLRWPNGLCKLCKPGETGEIVGMIRTDNPTRRFEGYLDKKETEKKIIKNIEIIGDCDRLGDTFRCCGENVSTIEVENILQDIDGIEELTVYGIELNNKEGKYGICSIVLLNGYLNKNKIIDKIGQKCKENLPKYAIPKYLKFCSNLERTGTFKLKKGEMQRKEFLNHSKDEDEDNLFIWNNLNKKYIKLN
ncbi:hypothetical protein Mgra_00006953 [Meloidogyne graminicola]|uniref:Long-chain-fatty-acid--CoA ligase n=1 Tax=Meloidogyne graminicola TaxID=189291 RepID=A0A8S9ZJN2_9BILA|nr:hypothetical protein Mgra_00006953 [Meloidogyne graminicola]